MAASRAEQRLDAERRLKRGELRALVATASLELESTSRGRSGVPNRLDPVDRRAAAAGRPFGSCRRGRAEGRLFPLSRDELCECAALLDAVRRGELDRLSLPAKPLDVLAQQIVAEVASQEWRERCSARAASYPSNDLLRQHVQWLGRSESRSSSPRRNGVQQRGALAQLVARKRKQSPLRHAATA